MENFALIFSALLIGYISNAKKIFPSDTPIILNKFIIYISLPAMIFLQIPKLSFTFDALIPVIISWIVMGLSAAIIYFLSKLFSFSRNTTGALLLVGVLGNTSFVGIPIVKAYLGEEALGYVLMYDQLGTFIFLSTYGTFISIYFSSEEKINMKTIAIKMLTFPTFVALILALPFIRTEFHPTIKSVLSSLASTIVPLALVSVGLQLRFILPSEELKAFSSALAVKLIVSPFIALMICYLFEWKNLASSTSIMEAAMGPMITAGAIASMSGLAPRLSSAIVGYGTLLSLGTTWIVFQFIH